MSIKAVGDVVARHFPGDRRLNQRQSTDTRRTYE